MLAVLLLPDLLDDVLPQANGAGPLLFLLC